MNVFEKVKETVTTKQVAEYYGFYVNHHGMTTCPFHKDRVPSMKVDNRFRCFGCGADGDAIDFVSRLFDLPSKEAAVKIAGDFGILYDQESKPYVTAKSKKPTERQLFEAEEEKCYRVLSNYFRKLKAWREEFAPAKLESELHPLFKESLQKHDYIEYLLNIMIYGSLEDRKALVAEQRNEVKSLERRFADISERRTEEAVGDDAKGQARKYSKQLQGSISERSSA
ncbi:MAG: CHC2 zinc finger domain-containing protein [Ruminococcus sp.]|nr:CHC2 zinc finger domain-containing protein [Ruminococcus sp.]